MNIKMNEFINKCYGNEEFVNEILGYEKAHKLLLYSTLCTDLS